MDKKTTIELHKYINDKDTALVGRDYGVSCLKNIEESAGTLIKVEEKYEKINFTVPKRIITINKSFFLGMFETRIVNLGKNGFESKYNFECSDYIKSRIPKYIDAALLNASMKDILSV